MNGKHQAFSRIPQAVIFDIGRVIVHLEPERAFARLSRNTAGDRRPRQIWQAILNDPRWNDWQEGRMDPRQWHSHLTSQLGISVGFDEFCQAWNRTLHPVPILKESLFANLASRCKLAVLSNTDPLHSAALESEFSFLRHFPARIYSWRVGASKPNPAIFRAALDTLHVDAGETLFVDDVPEFVQAARALGLDAVQFTNRPQLLQELSARGLPGE